MDFWWSIIIPSAISILGFIVTIFTTYKQFKNSKKERIIDRQSNLYLECYNKIEPIVNFPMLIFEKHYYDSIVLSKAEMKLVASNSTLRAYKEYLKFVYDIMDKYNIFCLENDPRINGKYIEIIIDEATGCEGEISHITEQDIQYFNISAEKYRNEHCPDITEIKKQIAKLLNSMRKDLSSDTIESDITE